ncbi:hypothetical protein LTR10_020459 [Elasticomyces elasticus]|uniref:FAD-binding domain-containing protein n=1 Tax=Exophiala sideris TaxID=1016849 RepID=A0ABR0J3N6_9EURO|nr:hypothetical protein LTR10_020459 [Elasticomyces elasticus]KAK5027015.1 hypothetical protein LTS07_007314 [Exophiala sideris]KAK5034019.1 hypothetical protein LTR13_006619 [Exophiala sideris]KAK5055706.1 hypothetical protein LTR69_008081 [Exophiala sideris]KAK5180961.1 hypothetical protein LTR44_006781 [Eurotiomycetes sp. CCFEE 6388]
MATNGVSNGVRNGVPNNASIGVANGATTTGDHKQTSVLIIGAGFAGMTAAIECRVRGMKTTLVEKYLDSNKYGDIIDFFANAGRIIRGWDDGKVADQLMEHICINNAKKFQMKKWTGETFYEDPWFHKPQHSAYQFAGHRGAMWDVIVKYCKKIGVEFVFGDGVVQYTEDADSAGVVLQSGKTLKADCVMAADGPKSLARQQVLGLADSRTNSGYAIYRSFFFVDDNIRANPLLKDYTNPDEDTVKFWIGPHVHMLAYSWNKGRDIAWVMTHKDVHDIGESWSFPGNKKEAAEYIKNFDPECMALLEATDPANFVDYKLVWREALETWRSPGGRTVLIGDAAHCHLPTSGQGGSQAMEDAVTAAICIDRAGGDVVLGLKVMERIRFNRSEVTWLKGIETRDAMHYADWEAIDKDRSLLSVGRESWILNFDPVKHANDHYEHLAEDVRSGKQGNIRDLSLPIKLDVLQY